MAPADMLPSYLRIGNQCATSFTRGFGAAFTGDAFPEGFYAIGAVFLQNVVAVFDIGKGGMWFAEHKY